MNTYLTLLMTPAYNAFWDREKQRLLSRGDSFLLNFILNCIYNLALTRRGINIIESDIDWNEYIGYFIPGHSI
jgi:hypothetical protein